MEQRMDTKERPSVAANVIAATNLSVKVASLCLQNSKHARNTNDDINRLREEATNLKTVLKNITKLLNGPNGRRLEGSQELIVAVEDSLSKLQRLEQELCPGITRTVLSRVGFRTLKWPLRSNDVEKTVQDLERCTQAMWLASQVDQTHIADVDDLKYFVMTSWRWPRSNPAGFLRTYHTEQTTHHEEYNFSKAGWEHTDFFLDYDRGHIDYDYEEVPADEAERLIQEKLRRKAEREQAG
ncbi:hypothetical protein BJX63DRAFT_376588 [Aspergillus granulosus]|uniref:Uncharacterized protein n=1 Tax=Aspergillus granulosus TaxID=176169 RepID=A0ABR4I4C8_9EURO